MLAAATVANIKIRYDAKTPQFAIFETRVIVAFYRILFTDRITCSECFFVRSTNYLNCVFIAHNQESVAKKKAFRTYMCIAGIGLFGVIIGVAALVGVLCSREKKTQKVCIFLLL